MRTTANTVLATFLAAASIAACARTDNAEREHSMPDRPISCADASKLISEFTVGLNEISRQLDPDDPAGTVRCGWSNTDDIRTMIISQEPRETSPEEMERIKVGKVYDGDEPPYRVIENDRLRSIDAVAVIRDDSDTVDEIGAFASLHLHTPHLRISVVAWTADAVLEIATRIAEAASK